MLYLIAGLILFLGIHSTRIFADGWRTQRIASMGEVMWKSLYTGLAIAGFILLANGYGLARQTSIDLWVPPLGMRHATVLFTLPIFIMLAAAYIPGTIIREKLKHPMLLSVKLWAFAHLLSNGRLADVLLFGGFLIWAALCFRAARQRDRQLGISYPRISAMRDVIAVTVGLVGWAVFTFYLHEKWIGIRPL